jgi:hypothetical protein
MDLPGPARETLREAHLPLNARKARARVEQVTCWLFGLALAAPLVIRFVQGEPESTADENREPARAPALPGDVDELVAFPDAFQAYYDDSFGLRGALLAVHSFVKLALFGVSPAKDVVVGKSGWLFLNTEHALEISFGYFPASPEHVESWVRALEERQRWLAERHIAYAFAIAPNKEEIYPDRVPERFARVGPSLLDALAVRAAEHGTSCFVDLRPALIAARAQDVAGDPLYYPGDTHWTARGAWVGCNALLAHLHAEVPALEPSLRESFVARRVPSPRNDLDREVGRANALESVPFLVPLHPRAYETAFQEVPKRERRFAVDDHTLPRVLFLHDSFGPSVEPYLAEHCAELVCRFDYSLAEDVIELLRPDVVIQLYTERGLVKAPLPLQTEVRKLSTSECAAIENTVDIGNLEAAQRLLVARAGTTITASAPGEAKGFTIEMNGAADNFATPPVAFASGAHPVVQIDITTPRATVLNVFYATHADPRYSRARACQIALGAGRNVVCFEILVGDVEGAMLVRPGLEPGRYVVHRLAIGSSRH